MKKVKVIGLKPDAKAKKKSSIIEGKEYFIGEDSAKILVKKKLVKLATSKGDK